jgi:hypothetical protein
MLLGCLLEYLSAPDNPASYITTQFEQDNVALTPEYKHSTDHPTATGLSLSQGSHVFLTDPIDPVLAPPLDFDIEILVSGGATVNSVHFIALEVPA